MATVTYKEAPEGREEVSLNLSRALLAKLRSRAERQDTSLENVVETLLRNSDTSPLEPDPIIKEYLRP